KYMTMGDMKTPDFDDLLAAFDIPDMVDPKAAIESGHDDHENHIKQNAHTDEDSHVPSSSDVGVSVIVKNVRNIESSEGVDKDGHHSTGNGLHNGFLTASALESYGKDEGKCLKEEGSASEATLKESAFNQFSPISSAEEFDDDEKIEVDDPPDKEEMRANFRANVKTGSVSQQEYDKLKMLGGENLIKPGIPASSNVDKNKGVKRETETNSVNVSVYEPFKARKIEDKLMKDNSEKLLENRVLDGKLGTEKGETNLASISQSKAKSSAKLSSCIAAIAALSAKKAATDTSNELQSTSRESSPLPKDMNESPRAIEKSPESQSLIDGAKKPSIKQPDSPRSVSSENSSKGSPSSPAGSTPAIPKVRIKTIKTSSGEIKRTVTRVCVHCNVVYSDVAALKSHIQGSHCEVFYKCPICPMAFKSAPSTHSHAYTQHPGIKIGEPKIIYKCSMCDTVFTLQPLLYRHFDQHIENQKVSVFKCPDCSLLYAQKQLMMDHIKSMHGTLKSVEGPPNLGINLLLSTKPTTQNSASHNKEDSKSINGTEKLEKKSPSPVKKAEPKKVTNPGWTCWECDRLFTQRDVYISHMRKEHGKQMKKHPCRQCDKSFSSSHSLCRHNRIKHKGIRKVYTCSGSQFIASSEVAINRPPSALPSTPVLHQSEKRRRSRWGSVSSRPITVKTLRHCPDSRRTFTKRLMLEKHIQLMHGIKDPDVKEMTESTNIEESEVKEDTKVPSPKRKLEEPVLEFRPPRGAITQPLKKLKINVFKVHKCAVCGFTTENLLQFHEHIPQHKSDGSSYQCRECGLCYTSHVSLSRHLFIVHKLKEPQPVSKQNGSGEDSQQENKPNHEDESSDNMVSDRKCKVCAKTFETEAALNTHMRTHGMAFIKSKRLSSAEK
ncbi:hypothetical protein UY3_16207, partial [Chelonia mydas]